MFAAAALVGQDLRRNLLAGARLALFLPVRALDFRLSVAQYAALVLTSLAFWLAGGMLRQGFPGHLDSAAFAVALAQIPLVLAACFLAARLFREPQLALAFAVLSVATDPVFEVVGAAVQLASDFDAFAPYAEAANWIFLVWSFAVLVRTQLVLTGWRGRRSVAALALFAVLLAGLIAWFPRTELWAPDDEDAEAGPSVLQEEIFHRQGMLLDEQVAALRPERPGIADLYFLGVAADGGQDTFYKELMSVKELLEDRFDVAGRSIVLVNNPATLKELPIASVSNLRAALEGLGRTIDAERDVVLLHITTHGSSDHRLYFNMPPLELDQLTPTALARMLADSGIKWKVIVISACYAGGYIESLKDDNTLIITASDATHTSFGCSADSDFTWFSQAYYDDALRETRSFTEAFEMAKETVVEREQSEGYAPSNPQMFLGRAMRAKLAELERRLDRGAVPDSKLPDSPIRPEKK
jgi:Peptidase C13 family